MDGLKYMVILKENLFQSARDCSGGSRSSTKKKAENTAKATLVWFKTL